MPIHDFRCRTCGHEFEALVRAQDPPTRCPSLQRRRRRETAVRFCREHTRRKRRRRQRNRGSARSPRTATKWWLTKNTGKSTKDTEWRPTRKRPPRVSAAASTPPDALEIDLQSEPGEPTVHDRGRRHPGVARRDSAIRLVDTHHRARVENVEQIDETLDLRAVQLERLTGAQVEPVLIVEEQRVRLDQVDDGRSRASGRSNDASTCQRGRHGVVGPDAGVRGSMRTIR